jgi:hypothetical protein
MFQKKTDFLIQKCHVLDVDIFPKLKIVAISIKRAYTKSNIPLMLTPDKLLAKSSHTFREAEQYGILITGDAPKQSSGWGSIKLKQSPFFRNR